MNESLKFSDYITTETVHAAFAGATDIAKAGGEATLRYIALDAWASVGMAMIVFVAFTLLGIAGLVIVVKQNERTLDLMDKALAICFVMMLTITPAALAGYKIAHNLPRAMEPAGAIIHDYIIGRAER